MSKKIKMVFLLAGIGLFIVLAVTTNLVTGAVVTVLLAIGYICIRDLRDSFRRGERCECCGDCSKCKIQCRSNEKYYGISHGGKQKKDSKQGVK